MVKGARQVGKTYLVREFGKKEYKSFVEINFIKNQEFLRERWTQNPFIKE